MANERDRARDPAGVRQLMSADAPTAARAVRIFWLTAFLAVAMIIIYGVTIGSSVYGTHRVITAYTKCEIGGAEAIARLGEAKEAARKLERYIGMPSVLARHKDEAASLLGWCGYYGVSPLKACLVSKDVCIRCQALSAVAQIGLEAKPLLPEVLKALHDRDVLVRKRAVIALGWMKIGDDEIVSAIRQLLLNDPDLSVRKASAEALNRMGVVVGADPTPGSVVVPEAPKKDEKGRDETRNGLKDDGR